MWRVSLDAFFIMLQETILMLRVQSYRLGVSTASELDFLWRIAGSLGDQDPSPELENADF